MYRDSAPGAGQDVRSEAGWEEVWTQAETFFGGRVEALINNAGLYGGKDNLDTDILAVNLTGLALGSRLALARMSVEAGGCGGAVVQLASVASLVATSASPLYAASKAGVLGLVRSHGLATHSRCPVPVSSVPRDELASGPRCGWWPRARVWWTRLSSGHTSHITHHISPL